MSYEDDYDGGEEASEATVTRYLMAEYRMTKRDVQDLLTQHRELYTRLINSGGFAYHVGDLLMEADGEIY